jgi:hypothetical protein
LNVPVLLMEPRRKDLSMQTAETDLSRVTHYIEYKTIEKGA